MYTNPTPVSVGVIPTYTPGHIIFVERGDGGIALPGGYVDALEDASAAVNREVFEEIGLELDTRQWQLFHSAVTTNNKLLLFSYYPHPVAVPVDFLPNDEIVRVFSAPWNTPLRFPLHSEAAQRWNTGMRSLPVMQPAYAA